MRAAYQFTKKVARWAVHSSPGLSVPRREIAAPGDAIASTDYISNPQLEKQFLEQKYRFLIDVKDAREELLFHGTAAASMEGILRTNFLVEQEPAVVAGQAARAKGMVFGPGIYLSALSAVSLMYGNSVPGPAGHLPGAGAGREAGGGGLRQAGQAGGGAGAGGQEVGAGPPLLRHTPEAWCSFSAVPQTHGSKGSTSSREQNHMRVPHLQHERFIVKKQNVQKKICF